MLFCSVLDRFLIEQKQEQEAEQITHGTLGSYRSMISRHIHPKWGDVYLQDVRPALVQDWLRKLTLSPAYKGHIRSLMYRLFDRAMIWELIGVDRNPMDLVEVKGSSKRSKRPRILQVKDAWRILDALAQPCRTIVLIALCFGLRISEILGLRWTDFDFKSSAVLIERSAVGKRLNKLKTECSQDEVPLERGFTPTRFEPTTWYRRVCDWDLEGSGSIRSVTHIVLGWTKPELLWACSRNLCVTRTFPPRWTDTAMRQWKPSAKPIGLWCRDS